MNLIMLSNSYFIEIDRYNHTLKKKCTGKKEEYEKVCGYFNSVRQAVEKFVKLNQLDIETKGDLYEYVEHVERCNEKCVNDILKGLSNGIQNIEK